MYSNHLQVPWKLTVFTDFCRFLSKMHAFSQPRNIITYNSAIHACSHMVASAWNFHHVWGVENAMIWLEKTSIKNSWSFCKYVRHILSTYIYIYIEVCHGIMFINSDWVHNHNYISRRVDKLAHASISQYQSMSSTKRDRLPTVVLWVCCDVG